VKITQNGTVKQQDLVDVSANAPELRRGILRTWDLGTYGTYTIEVTAVEAYTDPSDPANPATNRYVDIDGFVVDIDYRGEGMYDDLDGLIKYLEIPTWSQQGGITGTPAPYNGTVLYSDTAEDFVRLTFYGTAIEYIYSKAQNRGKAAITIDGVNKGELDLYSTARWAA
jgi:hypothetical protein